jgi:L-asparaginase
MFENLSKPVILTGSQLPIGLLRTDGRENLIVALEIATAKKDGKPLVPEVCIYFENHLFRGNRSHKFNAENFNAFISPNYPALADVGVRIKYNTPAIIKPRINFLIVHTGLSNNIAILKLFPGINKNFLDAVLKTKGLKALILETYGSGNAPTDVWLLDCLRQAISDDLIVLNITQCEGGSVEMGKYETSRELSQIGVIGGADMTTEAAITKLMYLLGESFSTSEIKKLLPISLRGELTE